MSTHRIVVMTAADEMRAQGMMILLFVLALIGAVIYTGVHWMFAEHQIPLEQLDVTWSDADAHNPWDGIGPQGTRSSSNLDLDITNNSEHRLYSLSWRATMYICKTPDLPVSQCSEVDSETGTDDPTVAAHAHGVHKLEIPWGDVGQYVGYRKFDLEFTDATGTND